jgi:hypothetical protein
MNREIGRPVKSAWQRCRVLAVLTAGTCRALCCDVIFPLWRGSIGVRHATGVDRLARPARSRPRLWRAPVARSASSCSICSIASSPAVEQKRSNELFASCHASSGSALARSRSCGRIRHRVALLRGSAPRGWRLKAGNRRPPISTSVGTFPAASQPTKRGRQSEATEPHFVKQSPAIR